MKHPKLLSPSALFLITFIMTMFLAWVYPWHVSLFMNSEMIPVTGVVILLTSLTINIFAYKEFKKSFTPHAPFKKPKVLIQKGIFAFSRNPVYLALVLSQFGLGFVFDTVWLLLGSLVLLIVFHYVIVADEEKMLESTFKESYRAYKKQTRRWI